MTKMRALTLLTLWLCCSLAAAQAPAQAPKPDRDLERGNAAYEDSNYAQAEQAYRWSKAAAPKKATAALNMGNAIYRQNQLFEAKNQFAQAVKNAKTPTEKHRSYHNLGNCLMQQKEYAGAVEAYKNALRSNPADEQTRYNFALAKKMLKNNPPKGDDKNKGKGGKDKDKDPNKGNQNKKDQDPNKQKNQGQNQPKNQPQPKPGEGDKQQKGQPKPNPGNEPQPIPGGMSKQRLESLLDAVNNEEKKIQHKMKERKDKAPPKQAEKDW